jgi:hypothetical protein
LVVTEKLRSVKHIVYQGGFTVIDVGYNSNVAQVHVPKIIKAQK